MIIILIFTLILEIILRPRIDIEWEQDNHIKQAWLWYGDKDNRKNIKLI